MNKLDYELKMKKLEDKAEEIFNKVFRNQIPSLSMLGKSKNRGKSKERNV